MHSLHVLYLTHIRKGRSLQEWFCIPTLLGIGSISLKFSVTNKRINFCKPIEIK